MIIKTAKDKCFVERKGYLLSRSLQRCKELGEVFTPTELVLEILDQLPNQVWLPGKTYLDPTCGNGQFLAAVLIIKMELGHTDALSTIYGVDLMQDNVDECRQRLIDIAGDTQENWDTVRNNIRCEDGLTYDYSFTKEPSTAETFRKEGHVGRGDGKLKTEKLHDTISESSLFG